MEKITVNLIKKLLSIILFFSHFSSVYGNNGGLANLGSTCFMNGTIQILSQIKGLREYLESKEKDYQAFFALDSEVRLEQEIVINFISLMHELQSAQVVSPNAFVANMDKRFFPSRSGGEDDAVVAITGFLTVLDKSKFNKDLSGPESMNLIAKKESECSFCKNRSYIDRKPENILNLDIKYNDLEQCLNNFYVEERVEGFKCDNCKQTSSQAEPYVKRYKIYKYPDDLLVSLKRFEQIGFSGNRAIYKKNGQPVSFPVNLDYQGNIYELRGFVCHSGSLEGGHYWAYTKDFKTNEWMNFNDRSATPISSSEIESMAKSGDNGYPYVFYYRKKIGVAQKVDVVAGGGAGNFQVLPISEELKSDFSYGVKFFKKGMESNAKLEYDIWNYVSSSYKNFIKLIGSLGPKWWKTNSPVVRLMYKKDQRAQIRPFFITHIEEKLRDAIDIDSRNFDTNTEWLFMENVSRTIMVSSKAINILHKDNIIKIENFINEIYSSSSVQKTTKERLRFDIYLKIFESFLRMVFLGITIEDCDLFITYDGLVKNWTDEDKVIDYISIKFVDLGECLVFGELFDNKPYSILTDLVAVQKNEVARFAAETCGAKFGANLATFCSDYKTQITSRIKGLFAELENPQNIPPEIAQKIKIRLIQEYENIMAQNNNFIALKGSEYEKVLKNILDFSSNEPIAKNFEKIIGERLDQRYGLKLTSDEVSKIIEEYGLVFFEQDKIVDEIKKLYPTMEEVAKELGISTALLQKFLDKFLENFNANLITIPKSPKIWQEIFDRNILRSLNHIPSQISSTLQKAKIVADEAIFDKSVSEFESVAKDTSFTASEIAKQVTSAKMVLDLFPESKDAEIIKDNLESENIKLLATSYKNMQQKYKEVSEKSSKILKPSVFTAVKTEELFEQTKTKTQDALKSLESSINSIKIDAAKVVDDIVPKLDDLLKAAHKKIILINFVELEKHLDLADLAIIDPINSKVAAEEIALAQAEKIKIDLSFKELQKNIEDAEKIKNLLIKYKESFEEPLKSELDAKIPAKIDLDKKFEVLRNILSFLQQRKSKLEQQINFLSAEKLTKESTPPVLPVKSTKSATPGSGAEIVKKLSEINAKRLVRAAIGIYGPSVVKIVASKETDDPSVSVSVPSGLAKLYDAIKTQVEKILTLTGKEDDFVIIFENIMKRSQENIIASMFLDKASKITAIPEIKSNLTDEKQTIKDLISYWNSDPLIKKTVLSEVDNIKLWNDFCANFKLNDSSTPYSNRNVIPAPPPPPPQAKPIAPLVITKKSVALAPQPIPASVSPSLPTISSPSPTPPPIKILPPPSSSPKPQTKASSSPKLPPSPKQKPLAERVGSVFEAVSKKTNLPRDTRDIKSDLTSYLKVNTNKLKEPDNTKLWNDFCTNFKKKTSKKGTLQAVYSKYKITS